MYPNLMGMKAYHGLTSEQMGKIVGLSRNSFDQKMKSGRFTPDECKTFCRYFSTSFDYLFATAGEIGITPYKEDDRQTTFHA